MLFSSCVERFVNLSVFLDLVIMGHMETLSKIFGNETKVKIMKLFLFNQEKIFSIKDISTRVKSQISKVRREMSLIEKMGLVKRRTMKNGYGFIVDQQFPYLNSLQVFLVNVEPLQPKEIIKKFSKAGSIKLIITSGVFIQELESRADLLIVGDSLKKSKLENIIKTIESEIGKELRYVYFTTEEFKYRLSMYDKLTRDILDYPHMKILNRLSLA